MGIVVRLDSRRLLVLGLIFALTIGSVYTYISALFAFITPQQRFPLKVMDVKTFDKGGDPSSIFSRGQTVRIDAEARAMHQIVAELLPILQVTQIKS